MIIKIYFHSIESKFLNWQIFFYLQVTMQSNDNSAPTEVIKNNELVEKMQQN